MSRKTIAPPPTRFAATAILPTKPRPAPTPARPRAMEPQRHGIPLARFAGERAGPVVQTAAKRGVGAAKPPVAAKPPAAAKAPAKPPAAVKRPAAAKPAAAKAPAPAKPPAAVKRPAAAKPPAARRPAVAAAAAAPAVAPFGLGGNDRNLAKPPGGTYASWEAYDERSSYWRGKHLQKAKVVFRPKRHLFHATRADLKATIAATGLQPKNPEWTHSYDASKDGFLSMATEASGAGAMGGTAILLRVRVEDVAGHDFKAVVGSKEVRTTQAIAAGLLEVANGDDWEPLVPRPAAAAAPAAAPAVPPAVPAAAAAPAHAVPPGPP